MQTELLERTKPTLSGSAFGNRDAHSHFSSRLVKIIKNLNEQNTNWSEKSGDSMHLAKS
jgi:hypothetical protein